MLAANYTLIEVERPETALKVGREIKLCKFRQTLLNPVRDFKIKKSLLRRENNVSYSTQKRQFRRKLARTARTTAAHKAAVIYREK